MASELLNRESYVRTLNQTLTLAGKFDPSRGPYANLVRNVPFDKDFAFEPIAPGVFFPRCHANIIGSEVRSVFVTSIGSEQNEHGILVDGNDRKANIYTQQQVIKNKNVGTTIKIIDQERDLHGTLELSHFFEKDQPDSPQGVIKNSATYELTRSEREAIATFAGYNELQPDIANWNLEWDFENKAWNVVGEGKAILQTMNTTFVNILHDFGFNIPSTIEESDAGGIKTEVEIGGKKVTIQVPTDLPKTEVMAAFLDGTPIVPFSIKIDGEEKVVDTSRKQIETWHEQLKGMEMTKQDFINLSRRGDARGSLLFRDLSGDGLFADYRVTALEPNGKGEISGDMNVKISHISQEIVNEGLERGVVKDDVGVNVAMKYNIIEGNGEFESKIVVQSDNGFHFKLISSMGKGDTNLEHNLRMRFTREQINQLKKGSTIAELYFKEDDIYKPSPVLDWSHEKRKFVLRKYKDFERKNLENEIDCSEEDLKKVFGFEIAPEEIRLDGPVAHLGIKTGKNEFSITVPSSLDGFNPTDAIRERGAILPITIFTNAEGEWRDVMRSN